MLRLWFSRHAALAKASTAISSKHDDANDFVFANNIFIDRLGFSIIERAIFFSSFIAESLIALKRILPPPMSSDNNVVRSNYSTSGEY